MKNKNIFSSNILSALGAICLAMLMTGCVEIFEFDLPEANSQIDTQLPTSAFVAAQSVLDFKEYEFQNVSAESTTFAWDFGDGGTSTEESPIYVFEGGEGTYTVTLTTSDANGATATSTQTIEVIEPEAPAAFVPPILEASFEDGMLEGGSGDGRDSWRNSELGGVIQITSSPVLDGSQASKFPSDGDRIAYQELQVTPNAEYKITYFYTIKTEPVGSITMDVLAGGGHVDVSAATVLGTSVGTDQTDSNAYVESTLTFDAGSNSTVSIYIHNEGSEARIDLISIESVE